jgi:hypothetical protein
MPGAVLKDTQERSVVLPGHSQGERLLVASFVSS